MYVAILRQCKTDLTGIYYIPTSNPSPRFNGTSRPGPNLWANSVIALDAQTGQLIWGKQLISHDVHDWDAGWGNSLATIGGAEGEGKRVVIVGTKRGDSYALDGQTGNILWNKTIEIQYNTFSNPAPNGSGIVGLELITVWKNTLQMISKQHILQ